MLSKERNDLLTRTDRGTAGGELLRRYWQPVAFRKELPPGGAPLPVKIMGEELVLFRDDQDRPGLLAINCCHRGSDISYGRVEDGGLRCLYHGWLFDINGDCLEQPAEPPDSTFKDKVHQKSYPCQEAGDTIFAYLGPGEPPLLPKLQMFDAPPERLVENRVFTECNYIQGNESNIDPAHTSFVHRSVASIEKDEVEGPQHDDKLWVAKRRLFHFRDNVCPDLEVEETRFGLRIYATRDRDDGTKHLRITNFVMPNLCAIGGKDLEFGRGGYHIHWHVPIDDHSHWRWEWIFHGKADMDVDTLRAAIDADVTPDYRHIRNQANRYLQDREEMKTSTYAGMGGHFPAHDANVIETMGSIQDRTEEHLGTTDVAIIAQRRLLFEAIEEVEQGNDPLHVIRDEKDNDYSDMVVLTDVVDKDKDIKERCRELAEENMYV
ncbi:MAG: Rieske 2Fe-2S domain-containing protein [Alphaproteobacteria bacterium]|nr:Rieske 2Fe-2S domain-containing protein [Alphaproteobacteria bacterium]